MKKWPLNYVDCQQGSAEWFSARTGCVTASRLSDVMAKLKNGASSAAREKYKMEMLTEILTGQIVEHYVSPAMDFGRENEGVARAQYEIAQGVEVDLIGFCYHPGVKRSGASPDGLVGKNGLVELKVPNTATHLGYLLSGVVPEEYKPQMFWQMACAQRDWCDFVSFDPRLPDDFSLFIVRLDWDEEVIRAMEAEVEKFIGEVNEMAEKLQKYRDEHHAHRSSDLPASEIPDAAEWLESRPD